MTRDVFLSKCELSDKNVSDDVKIKYLKQEFGQLILLDIIYATKRNSTENPRIYARCDCKACGREIYTSWDSVRNGNTVSCGCLKSVKAANAAITKSKNNYIGMKYKTREGYTIEIVDLNTTHNVKIKFIDVDIPYETTSTMQNIKNGQIKYPYKRNQYGGYYGVGPYTARTNGVKTIEYRRWIGILFRCNYQSAAAYINVSVCDEWLNFQNFAKWYNDNKYECELELDIDKDILSYFSTDTNLQYSANTCVIIPSNLNSQLIDIHSKTPDEVLKLIHKYHKYIPSKVMIRIDEYFYNQPNSYSKTSLIAGSSLESK